MRLIDGDDLYRKVVGYNGGAVDKTVAKRLIEQQPTVQRNSTQSNASNTLNALDCISRQAAIDLCDWYDNPSMHDDLEKLPSAQPEIIRCKDCKYNCCNAEAGIAKCCMFHAKTNLYGFCYLGERRTDETD